MPATDTTQLAPIYGVLMLDKSPLCAGPPAHGEAARPGNELFTRAAF